MHLFQLGHFLAEMDRGLRKMSEFMRGVVSIGPLLSRNG